jgi:uncharacterized protein (TIRG00374 family)
MLRAYHEGIDTLKEHPKGIIVPIVFSILAWLSDLLIVLLVFFALRAPIPIVYLIVVYSISVAIPMIPISISGVGPTEIIMTTLYQLFGISAAISATVTLLTRIVTVWFKLIVGYFAVHLIGVDILSRHLTESMMPQIPEEKDSASVG